MSLSYSHAISVPGRVNLIGEHIDYHHLPVLPMAIQRHVSVSFEPRTDSWIQASSQGHPDRAFLLTDLNPFSPGDWGNYLKAAVRMIGHRWSLSRGISATITSDLPLAAGLSSSSALLSGFALALLRANEIHPTIGELMELMPEGEQFVGTRGGGMDHAAVLGSRAGCALLVRFAPLELQPIPIPPGWAFIVAHSLTTAEKSGAVKAEYNSRRTAGLQALQKLSCASFADALSHHNDTQLAHLASTLPDPQRDAFLHVTSEGRRVEQALVALEHGDIETFGGLLSASHFSLRDRLHVSSPALDELVDCALSCGAAGARLTGAGFGGCAIILCKMSYRKELRRKLTKGFYTGRPGFVPQDHLIAAEPSDGALNLV